MIPHPSKISPSASCQRIGDHTAEKVALPSIGQDMMPASKVLEADGDRALKPKWYPGGFLHNSP